MALSRRGDRQQEFSMAAQNLPKSPGHPFHLKLNKLLQAADFDLWVEGLCEEYCAKDGERRC